MLLIDSVKIEPKYVETNSYIICRKVHVNQK